MRSKTAMTTGTVLQEEGAAAVAARRAAQVPPSPRPPRGPSLGVLAGLAATFVVALVVGTAASGSIQRGVKEAWQLAFHQGPAETAPARVWYTSPMDRSILQDHPGIDPKCGMALVPVTASELTAGLQIDPVVVQNIGVRIEPVTTGPLVASVRTVGTVDYAEPLVKDVSTKVGGWVEKLDVTTLGQQVKAGDPLFELYSPELYAAQEEYLLAYRSLRQAGRDAAAEADSQRLLESARTKLAFDDIAPAQIKDLEKAGVPAKTMALRAPQSGVVIEKHVLEGMKIEAGTAVYRIADLSKVWVMATVYEYQLPYLQVGQEAVVTLPYIPGAKFDGKVVYIYPYMNESLREVKVRLELDNARGVLKPGMFANVELRNELAAHRTLAPRSAVIDTGTRQVAFVSLGDGHFEPRDVKIGADAQNDQVEILDGLKPGEMVVTSGQFLLDSEAKMREGLAKMIKGDMASGQHEAAAVTGHAEVARLPPAVSESLAAAVNSYAAIGDGLAKDSSAGLGVPARQLAEALAKAQQAAMPGDPDFWRKHEEIAVARGKALELESAADLAAAREEYADLSTALAKLLHATGSPPELGKSLEELHCPMYRKGQGGNVWLQFAGPVRNPYFGAMMPDCFDRRESIPAAPTTAPAAPRKD